MSDSLEWDGTPRARKWLQDTIPGSVVMFDEWARTLMLRTGRGEQHVPYGWVITRGDDGTVSIAPGGEVA